MSGNASILELILFNLVSSLPFYLLLIHPFKNRLRYSKFLTGFGYVIVFIISLIAYMFTNYGYSLTIPFFANMLLGIAYGFIFIDDIPGRSMMTFFILFDFMNAIMVFSKYFEYLLFPANASSYFKITHTVIYFIIATIACLADYVYSEKIYVPALHRSSDGGIWRYMWIIPFAYAINIYASVYLIGGDIILFCFSTMNVFSLLIVTLSAIITFYTIIKLVNTQYARQELIEKETYYQNELNYDTLTSAYSRKFGEDLLEDTITNQKSPIIMMCDIDHFKNINDTYGHDIGDQALIAFTNCLKATCRSTDAVIRWGGDEYVCIFDGLSLNQVDVVAEKIKNAVSNVTVHSKMGDIKFTCSMGFTVVSEDETDINDILKRADNALYKAKSKGRNTYFVSK